MQKVRTALVLGRDAATVTSAVTVISDTGGEGQMHIESDRALIPAHIPAARHLTVTITAPPRKAPARERPPVNVSLGLDRSGSMAGRKIDMARKAVAHAIQLLDGRDKLAVVVYDDRIDTILEPTAASKDAKKKALDRLAHVEARGSTDLAGGWFAGVAACQGRSK